MHVDQLMHLPLYDITVSSLYIRPLSLTFALLGDTVSLYFNEDGTGDVALKLLEEGFLLAEQRRERRFQKVISEYKSAQNIAKKNRVSQHTISKSLHLFVFCDLS